MYQKIKSQFFKSIICVFVVISPLALCGQKVVLERIEPVSWWTGMENQNLQLLVYGKNIATTHAELEFEGVYIKKIHSAESPNYLFIDLEIRKSARPGTFQIVFKRDNKKITTFQYTLHEKGADKSAQQGLDAGDVIYLITPDRFVNGNPKNDVEKGMLEGITRNQDGGRHGGDLEGIISKLDYLEDLGVTTLWLNPVLENNMPEYSYHGYAITDFYKVDPRYGSNALYKQLANELHQRGMKIVMDMIFNHSGSEHWWMKDMPFKDWINNYPKYTITNHAIASISDPYAAQVDLDSMEQGWFVPTMPDLNHKNPFVANYLIQNSIWWIEYAGLDGIRMDTYPYNLREMMAAWVKRVKTEYPNFFLLGETWVDNEAHEAFWATNSFNLNDSANSFPSSITDFPFCYAIHKAFKEEGDVIELYKNLSKDFLYKNPESNTIFVDNHDMDRIYHVLGEDIGKFKMAMTYLFTARGIPQLYYGTEILMKGNGPHGVIREDFPGGWEGDKRNAFISLGRTDIENEAFEYLRALLNWRKSSNAIKKGNFKHFIPQDNVYVYGRKSADESLLIVINNNDQPVLLSMERFKEVIEGCAQGLDVISGEVISDIKDLEIKGNSSIILNLMP